MPLKVNFSPAYLGLKNRAGYRVQDIYQRMELGTVTPGQNITIKVNPLGVRFLRFDILPSSYNSITEEEEEEDQEYWVYCKETNPGLSGWRNK